MARHARSLAVAAVVVAGLSACGGTSGVVVARVSGYAITKATLDHWLAVGGAGTGGAERQVLGFLIGAQWTVGEARELGVTVSDGEAQKQLTRFKYVQLEGLSYERFPNEAELKRSLASKKETPADQVWLMKLNMLEARTEQKRLSNTEQQITPAEIAGYYDKNRRMFVLPERRDIEIMLSYDEAAMWKAKREVQAGKGFLSVARRVSVDPEAPNGVQLGLARGEEEPEFIAHIYAARLHVLNGPIRQAGAYYVFELTKIRPPVQQTLAQSEATIRRRLAVARQRQASSEINHALTSKWTARTNCSPGYVAAQCG